ASPPLLLRTCRQDPTSPISYLPTRSSRQSGQAYYVAVCCHGSILAPCAHLIVRAIVRILLRLYLAVVLTSRHTKTQQEAGAGAPLLFAAWFYGKIRHDEPCGGCRLRCEKGPEV